MSRQLIKQEHFKNLSKFCYTNGVSADLQEYFQFLKNSNIENSDKSLFKNHKKNLNDLNSNEIRKENEATFVNKNQYHSPRKWSCWKNFCPKKLHKVTFLRIAHGNFRFRLR